MFVTIVPDPSGYSFKCKVVSVIFQTFVVEINIGINISWFSKYVFNDVIAKIFKRVNATSILEDGNAIFKELI